MFDFGIQLYSKQPITSKQISDWLVPTPYESMESTNSMIGAGVVFFRDSEHAQGAFAEAFCGDGFYSQWFVNEKTGEVLEEVILNRPVFVDWVKAEGVHRNFTTTVGVVQGLSKDSRELAP